MARGQGNLNLPRGILSWCGWAGGLNPASHATLSSRRTSQGRSCHSDERAARVSQLSQLSQSVSRTAPPARDAIVPAARRPRHSRHLRARLALPVGAAAAPTGRRRRAHWELLTLPLGVSRAPTGSFASSHWAFRKSQWESQWELPVGVSKCASKSEWAHGGRGSRRAGWRLARRGGPHRVPLGGASGSRATIGRAPLPVRYLPTAVLFVYSLFVLLVSVQSLS